MPSLGRGAPVGVGGWLSAAGAVVGSVGTLLVPELGLQVPTELLADVGPLPSDFGPVGRVERGGRGRGDSRRDGGRGGRTWELLGRPVGPALHVDAAHDGEAADDDAGRAGDYGSVTEAEAAAAHEGEPTELDVEALRHDDVDAAPEGEGGDLDLGAFDLRAPQVHVAAAHDGDGLGLAPDAPAAAGRMPTHDGDVPAARLPRRDRSRRRRRGGGRGQVGHDGVELASGLGLEGGAHALGELVERQAPLDDVLSQHGHGSIPIRFADAAG